MGDINTALGAASSIAGAFGGGGNGGGMVVGGPSPTAAMRAALYNANAATQAGQYAQQSVNDAISAINKNYQQARYDVQPYRSEGVQALNQLNQYLGLSAYNPGNAPTPITLQSELAKLDPLAIRNYINQNTTLTPGQDKSGNKTFLHPTYIGEGADNPELLNNLKSQWDQAYKSGFTKNPYSGGAVSTYNVEDQAGFQGADIFGKNTPVWNLAANYLANQKLQQDLPGYQQNQAEWQQNKNWYDQYTAAGPKTQAQISEEISNQPGYQAELGQGIDAISKSSSAKGYLGSGRALKELNAFGQNTLSKYYNNTLDRLQSLVGSGQQAASQSAQTAQNLGSSLAGLNLSLGENLANSALARGNAISQGTLAANQQYKIIGGSSGGMK